MRTHKQMQIDLWRDLPLGFKIVYVFIMFIAAHLMVFVVGSIFWIWWVLLHNAFNN